jgi:hypothetical protein
MPKLLLEHRLHAIKIDFNIQTSPLILNNFSAFSKTFRFRTDFLFRLLTFTSKLVIAFASPLSAPQDLVVTKHTPIYELFHDAPSVYAKNLYLFKKHNITHLSDCLSNDGLIILLFRDIIKKNSIHPLSAIIPIWYHTIINKTSVSECSLRLKDIITATHNHYNLDALTASDRVGQCPSQIGRTGTVRDNAPNGSDQNPEPNRNWSKIRFGSVRILIRKPTDRIGLNRFTYLVI